MKYIYLFCIISAPVLCLFITLKSMPSTDADFQNQKQLIMASIQEGLVGAANPEYTRDVLFLLTYAQDREALLHTILKLEYLTNDRQECTQFIARIKNQHTRNTPYPFPDTWYRTMHNLRNHSLLNISMIPIFQKRLMLATRSLCQDSFNYEEVDPKTKKTFLHYAGRLCNWYLIDFFLEKGLNPFDKDAQGSTVLHEIIKANHFKEKNVNKKALFALFERAEYLSKKNAAESHQNKKNLLHLLWVFKQKNIPDEIKYKIIAALGPDLPTYIYNTTGVLKILPHTNPKNFYFLTPWFTFKSLVQVCKNNTLSPLIESILIPAYTNKKIKKGMQLCQSFNNTYTTPCQYCMKHNKPDLALYCDPKEFEKTYAENIFIYLKSI